MNPQAAYWQRRKEFVRALRVKALDIHLIKNTLIAAVNAGDRCERDFDHLFNKIFVVYERNDPTTPEMGKTPKRIITKEKKT